MKKGLNIINGYLVLFLISVGLILVPFIVSANTKNFNISDPNATVCEALGRIGIGCGTPYVSNISSPVVSASPVLVPLAVSSPTLTGDTSNNSSLTATIYNSGSKNKKRGDVILVRIIGRVEIYEIIGGKKHFIPTKDIFYDYGFRDELIQNITAEELNRYPRVKLIRVEGNNKKTYYLTEGQMSRLIPNKKIFDSYGDREEDIIIISKKEFNFYPSDQFIFLERPLKRDVFQIVNGKKRYVTSMAAKRMKIRNIDVAPVNETELSYYKTGSSIIF